MYQPFDSPHGARIIMFGMNGGKTVEIPKASTPGFKSNIETVLTLDFNTTNVDDYNVFNDFAYIQHEGLDLFVVSSSSDYKVAIVDMASKNKDVSYVMLKETPYVGRSRGRQIEHVEGTDYVWIGGRQDNEAYVVNVATKKLVRTFTEVDTRKLVSVKNHAFFDQAQDYGTFLGSSGPASTATVQTVEAPKPAAPARPATAIVTAQAATQSDESSENEGTDTLAIAALVLSCIAIVAVIASFSMKQSQATKAEARPLNTKTDDPSVAVPPSVN